MKMSLTAIITQRDGWWLGWIKEIPGINCQERTHDDLVETLRVTLREAIEFNREQALEAIGGDYAEEPIEV